MKTKTISAQVMPQR